MAGHEIQVRLFRDALTTPWGFRLTGGKDLHAPLVVQRVAVGSPVDGELHRDDIILEIHGQNATGMTHSQAQEAIRNAGGSLIIRVKRPVGRHNPDTSLGHPGAHQYNPHHRGFMLGRLQETLNNVSGLQPQWVSDYALDSGIIDTPTPKWTRAPPKQRPPTITKLSDPGWTPQCLLNQPQQPARRPQTATGQPQALISSALSAGQSRRRGPGEHDEAPAWFGSLRPSVESKLLDQRAAGFQPSGDSGAAQRAISSTGGPSTIVLPEGGQHLQYNSPLALYNNANIQQVVASNFGGVPGPVSGTAKPNDSSVYRMVQENDRVAQRRSAPSAGAQLNPPQSDSIRQSPSVLLLESRFVSGQSPNNAAAADAAVGITDF